MKARSIVIFFSFGDAHCSPGIQRGTFLVVYCHVRSIYGNIDSYKLHRRFRTALVSVRRDLLAHIFCPSSVKFMLMFHPVGGRSSFVSCLQCIPPQNVTNSLPTVSDFDSRWIRYILLAHHLCVVCYPLVSTPPSPCFRLVKFSFMSSSSFVPGTEDVARVRGPSSS